MKMHLCMKYYESEGSFLNEPIIPAFGGNFVILRNKGLCLVVVSSKRLRSMI